MRAISTAEALRELNKWNSNSRVGCIYVVHDLDFIFSVRSGSLEIRDSDMFLEASNGKALMHLVDCEFSITEEGELPRVLVRGFPPLSTVTIRVGF